MRLTTAEIDRYGPLVDCRPPCREGLSVLSGPNEAGKTLYLEALLQLLEPDVVDVMSPGPRVDQPPTGRVLVDYAGEEFECDGETTVGDISEIDPSHLESVFVVRDNDLLLPSDQSYYTSLIEKLGDIHTTEIGAIKSALKDKGRLTSTRLNISGDRSHDDAKSVRADANALADEIREYTGRIEEEALDELAISRLRIKRRLRESREKLEVQREAKLVAEYERLSEQLESYRETSEQLDALGGFDRDALDELQSIQTKLERDRATLEELESDIEDQESEVEQIGESLEEQREELSGLNQRKPSVDEARSALETFRERQDDAAGAERQLSIARTATIAGIVTAGGAGVVGALVGSTPAIGLGVGLLLVAIVSGLIWRRSNQQLAAIETARQSVIQSARDVGFDVEQVENVAPAIESFETKLSRAQDRVARTDQRKTDAEEALSDLRDDKSELERSIADAQEELETRLEAADVETIDEFRDQVESRENLTADRRTARQSLVDRFGEPGADGSMAKADSWEEDLDDLIDGIDLTAVDVDTYDEAELARLETDVEELQSELSALQDQLQDHDDQLDKFDRRARGLNTQPFIGQNLTLEARSREGLESLASELDRLVREIEEDAELSRKALEIFGEIEEREEEKLTDLFDPNGPASRTLAQLTDGRYTEVAYDAETHDLVVERRDGRTFNPRVLSQGTKDQLYFATRVSLAKQLLGNEPGFLLLDDPFLAADPERLIQGFETLLELADDGWQIFYFTAKQEVSETMVEEFSLEHEEMDPIQIER